MTGTFLPTDGAFIRKVTYYLPEHKITNEDLAREFPSWNAERTEQITGIKTRYLEDKEVPASDMALAAAEKIFAGGDVSKEEIDFLIVVTQSNDYRLPCTACILQNKLGLPTTIGALDVNLGCSGYVYGLSLAKGLLSSGAATNVLLFTVEKTSSYIHKSDVAMRHISGDAAAATLVSRSGFAKIGEADFGSDGSGWHFINILAGGSARPCSEETSKPIQAANASLIYPEFVHMEGMEIFNFVMHRGPATVRAALAKNGLGLDDIALFLFHQANKSINDRLARTLKIPEHKVPSNIADVGNTSSCTVPLLFADVMEQGGTKPGDRLLLSGFGVGLSWASTVVEIV